MKVGFRICILATVVLGLVTVSQVSAIPLTIGDSHELGFVNYGIPAGSTDLEAYVNAMIGLGLGGSTTVTESGHLNTVTRSFNSFSPLDTAVLALQPALNVSGSTDTINLGTGGYEYLLAKYDGPNFGSEVWYIGGLTGTITIPAFGTGTQYGISGTSLFTPSTTTTVPDSGSTLFLLGSVLAGIGIVGRRLK